MLGHTNEGMARWLPRVRDSVACLVDPSIAHVRAHEKDTSDDLRRGLAPVHAAWSSSARSVWSMTCATSIAAREVGAVDGRTKQIWRRMRGRTMRVAR